MAKTADRTASDGLAPREVGRQLRHVRRKQGLSRSEVARSAGLTRRELAAYERGRAEVPESDLWCLAGSCGVDVSELLPNRAPVKVSSDLSLLAIGDSIRYLRNPVDDDEMLREYLAMIYELRNLPPGSRIPLRERDLMSLADALGGNPERIEARLVELIGMSHQEAARLRAMILPSPSLPAPAHPTEPTDPNNPYSQLTEASATTGDSAVVDFFSAPRASDVFEPPPPPGPLPATNGWSDAFEPPSYVPFDPGTPVAPPADVLEPYDARPGSLVDSAAPFGPVDPFAAPPPVPPAFAPEPATPAPPVGYLVDEPVAPEWPAYVPTSEPPAFDAPTVDWAMQAPPVAPPAPAAPPFVSEPPAQSAVGGSFPSAPVTEAPSEPWLDADPLPRRLPLSGAAVAPPVAPPAPPEVYEVPMPVAAPEVLAAPLAVPDALVIPAPPAPPAPAPPAPPVAPIVWSAGMHPESEAPASPAPGPSFERAGSNWRVGGIFPATATADDGALALRRADARWALADVDAPGDFTLEASVDFTAGAGFGVLFRATVDDHDRVSGYSFDIDPIAGGGGYLVRQWEDNRQHWRPLAQSGVTDPTLLFGRHTVSVSLRADQLTVVVDGETVLSVPALSRCSVELGRAPCRGPHVGIQAWATTEVTIDSFRVARH